MIYGNSCGKQRRTIVDGRKKKILWMMEQTHLNANFVRRRLRRQCPTSWNITC